RFSDIRTVAEFQARVPVSDYDAMWNRWWRPGFPDHVDLTWPDRIPYFAVTSGTTTGRAKNIPVSTEMIRSNLRAGVRLLEHFVSADPASRVWGGRTIFLGGSTGLRRAAPGVRIGDLSGIAAATQPFWARLFTSPPPRIAILSDWDRKLDLLARGSIGAD